MSEELNKKCRQTKYREKHGMKQFNTSIPAVLLDALNIKLAERDKSKKDWLCEKIKEELKKR